jgi:hypothetical protein
MAEYYDRLRAHEYYLRTRKLKGRKTGSKPPLSSIKPSSSRPSVSKGLGKKASKATKPPTQLRSEAQARVTAIKARLSKLESALKALLKESESSKEKSKTKTPEKSGKESSSSSKPLTAAQKAAKKKTNEEYYDKHKKPAEKKATGTHDMTNEQKIEEVRAQIKKARAQLKAAVIRARQSSTKPANGMKGR